MESLPEAPIIKFNDNTLNYVRKLYDLDKKERLEDSINHLVEWIKKQDHFVRKDFSREYLERTIILCKGSLEKSKIKLDKICTFRTLLPAFFESFDIENSQLLNDVKVTILPKMTKDYHRIFMFKNCGQRFDSGFLDFYRYAIRVCEFIQANDYCAGIICIFDYSDANLMEVVKVLNLFELQQTFRMATEGYGMRLKSIHFTTPSKAVDILIGLFKQVVSAKLGERIKVHRNIEGIYDFVPKEILPSDFGGNEKSIEELQIELKKVLFSDKFNDYFNEMNERRTNEALRREDKLNNQCMGLPGSFRKLDVD